jgi:hypothetical protein
MVTRSVALGLGEVGVVAEAAEVVEADEALAAMAGWCGFRPRFSGGFIRVLDGDSKQS